MNTLIAKVRSEYLKVLTKEEDILDNFDISRINTIPYTPSYRLDEDEWFVLSEFSANDFFIIQCRGDFSSVSLNTIDNEQYKDIAVLGVLTDTLRYFQRITPGRFVERKRLLDYSGDPKIVEHRRQIEIKKESDAIYNASLDKLYFKSIGRIKPIFPGIEVLHREATQPEVETFLGNQFIEIQEGYTSNSVGTQNRKRIADVGAKFNSLTIEKKQRLIEYAREKAGLDLSDENNFEVSSDNDLKNLLYAMDQRYYFADIYEENRVANSIKVIEN